MQAPRCGRPEVFASKVPAAPVDWFGSDVNLLNRLGTGRFGARLLLSSIVLTAVLACWPGAAEPAAGPAPERNLTLAECILLAVQNNRDLASGRLDRLAHKLSLQDSEDEFRLTPAFSVLCAYYQGLQGSRLVGKRGGHLVLDWFSLQLR